MTPSNKEVSIDALLARRLNLGGINSCNEFKSKTNRKPIDVSLEKYQEAVDFYADHPNQEMYKSYLASLSTCKTLKEAFELSDNIAKETMNVRKKRLKGMDREESLGSLLMQRVTILESIRHAKVKLIELKQDRVELNKNKKPH